jgi:hypothetical protein
MSNTRRDIVFTGNGMGAPAEQALWESLAGTFLRIVGESGDLPMAIGFYTDGVRMACEGSPVPDELRALEARGVRLVLCSTCLSTFGLEDQVGVGIVGGMGDIVTVMQAAGSVTTLP